MCVMCCLVSWRGEGEAKRRGEGKGKVRGEGGEREEERAGRGKRGGRERRERGLTVAKMMTSRGKNPPLAVWIPSSEMRTTGSEMRSTFLRWRVSSHPSIVE